MAARALLLDLDGTVWDSRGWYAEAVARLSGAPTAELAAGLAAGASVARLASAVGVSRARLARAARDDGASVELYEGVLDTLDYVRAHGTMIGVVSNLPGWLARPLLASTGIEEYVAAIATPRPGVPAKPSPHGIESVLRELGRTPDAGTWVVGDGRTDAAAARAAGVRFAWASYGYETAQPPGTTKVLAGFGDVLDL